MRIKIDNDMKRIFTLMLLSLAVVMGGCEKDNTYEDPGLDVSLYNIAGVWKLATWNGGMELAEGSYVYVELSYRDGNTFTIYQNLDSFGPRRITGSYSLYTDDALGAVIRGMYDYENGDWASRYVIRDLYEDRMTWIAVGDETNVSEYVRCEAVPEEILSQFGAAEEESSADLFRAGRPVSGAGRYGMLRRRPVWDGASSVV